MTVNGLCFLSIHSCRVQQVRSLFGCNQQEARKQRSGRSLNEDTREESADKKRGIFFSWSRNRSFGKGPKKKDIGDINVGEKRENVGVVQDMILDEISQTSSRGCEKSPVCLIILLCAVILTDYWGSNGRRESQGSLSSGASLEMATSCKAEVGFHWTDLHGNMDRAITISSFFFACQPTRF